LNTLLSEKIHLERIQSILRIEIPAYLLLSISLFSGIGFLILKIVILFLSPYLIFILFQLKKFGWITAFCLIVIVPLILSWFNFAGSLSNTIFTILPYLTFLIFTFLLKMVIPDWLEEINGKIFRRYKTDLPK